MGQDGGSQQVGRGKFQGERKVKRQWGEGQEKEKRQRTEGGFQKSARSWQTSSCERMGESGLRSDRGRHAGQR